MEDRVLGRTGLRVTVAGLGCGGHSRLGIDKGPAHAAGIVRAAYHSGVNFFDTATVYGTESAVGEGLIGFPRQSYVLSTKFPPLDSFADAMKSSSLTRYEKSSVILNEDRAGRIIPSKVEEYLDQSLRDLKTDYIDVYSIHALVSEDYEWAKSYLVPELIKAKEKGKIRFIGITEYFIVDNDHKMLKLALPDDIFDVIMVGYSIINPSAAKSILPLAIKKNLGVLAMHVVRKSLHDQRQFENDVAKIIAHKQGGAGLCATSLDFLTKRTGASERQGEATIAASLPEAAYRFARHCAGIHVTLTGTGNAEHLRQNLASIQMSPLPETALARLEELFGDVDCVCGQ